MKSIGRQPPHTRSAKIRELHEWRARLDLEAYERVKRLLSLLADRARFLKFVESEIRRTMEAMKLRPLLGGAFSPERVP